MNDRDPTDMEIRVAHDLWKRRLQEQRHPSGVHDNFRSALAAWPAWCGSILEDARVSIRAMYEPDDSMLAAYMNALEQPACPQKEPWHKAKMRKRWRAMIDAASPMELRKVSI